MKFINFLQERYFNNETSEQQPKNVSFSEDVEIIEVLLLQLLKLILNVKFHFIINEFHPHKIS